MADIHTNQIRATVREAYGAVASQKQQGGCCGGGTSCCGPTGSLSTRLGYTDADLAAVPDERPWVSLPLEALTRLRRH